MSEKELTVKSNKVLVDLTLDILNKCKNEGVEIRVLGSIGIFLKCIDYQDVLNQYRPPILDIDLISRHCYIESIESIFHCSGFEQNQNFKILFGYQRRIFYTSENITIEVFLENLPFNQEIKIDDRLVLDYPTISITDLFLSKIQRIHLEQKDFIDLYVLLLQHQSNNKKKNKIDLDYISDLCAKNWNWWKTLKMNIKKLQEKKNILDSYNETIITTLNQIEKAIDSKQKSIKWKMRSLIGEKMKWYKHVENN